jgi:hypothetical protein
MLRFTVSAIALASVLATALPACADPLAATASEHHKAAATSTDQAAHPVPAWSPSSDAAAPARDGRDKDIPVGFGWG